MMIKSINPANGQITKSYTSDTDEQISAKIEKAAVGWESWRKSAFDQRASLILKIAEILVSEKNTLAELMAVEMGKPIKNGMGEVEKCAAVCRYYAENAVLFLHDEIIETEASKSYVSYQPIGVVLAIMPWNFPFWQCFRFLTPALMAGNCGLLKHASNVPGCAFAIRDIFNRAGFPDGVFEILQISGREVSKVIENPVIKAVTLTGSTEAGKEVAKLAGSLIKKTVLELGGSDPYIILEDADLELAAKTCAMSRLTNNGQSCISAKRFIVDGKVEEEFVGLLKENMEKQITGDPLNPETQLGPMASVSLRDELNRQVLQSMEQGATCVLGGFIPDRQGEHAFYTPTILTNVKKGVLAYHEEIFGPVASVIRAKDKEDAISIANDTVFGLGAAIFTADVAEGERIAREELQAGSCFVNTFVRSDPRLPFGGIKESGYGRELSLFGVREFVNIKTVLIS